jgi:hypothetical protein
MGRRYGDDVAALAMPLTDAGDLDALLERVGDARVVMLGEASHGTHEYYQWRSAITRRLIAERGFSFLAVEGDWPDCARVDHSVRGMPDAPADPREALLGFERWPTWMWANEEVVDLITTRDPHLPARVRTGGGAGGAGRVPVFRAVRRRPPGVRVGDPAGAHQL